MPRKPLDWHDPGRICGRRSGEVGRHIHGVRVYSAQASDLIDQLTVAELLFSTRSIGAVQEAQAVAVCGGRGVKVRRLLFEIR
jgi:hypothetical protein